jgi:hypothetical protein
MRDPARRSAKGLVLRTLAYTVLAVTCLLSASAMLSHGRYGLFAPLVQILLAFVWFALAAFPWSGRKE